MTNEASAGIEKQRALPTSLLLTAYLELVRFGFCLAGGRFRPLRERVRKCSVAKGEASSEQTERVCSAIDLACIWYWKEVLCLQRSAATVCLLRRYGAKANLIIGVQPMPFKAHAWAEVDDRVVNDKPYVREMYTVLDVC
jgi:hypothetical protein